MKRPDFFNYKDSDGNIEWESYGVDARRYIDFLESQKPVSDEGLREEILTILNKSGECTILKNTPSGSFILAIHETKYPKCIDKILSLIQRPAIKWPSEEEIEDFINIKSGMYPKINSGGKKLGIDYIRQQIKSLNNIK